MTLTPAATDRDPTTDPDCLFCRIVAGEIPSRQVFADDEAVAFLDVAPWQRGHTLVVPRRHLPDVVTGPSVLTAIAPALDVVGRLLVQRLGADGLNLLSSAGTAAGQEIFHLHVHLVPRYADAPGLRELFQRAPASATELDAVLARVMGG